MLNRENTKWPLLFLVLFLVVINYFAFLQVVEYFLEKLDNILSNIGYYFSVKEPIIFLFSHVVPFIVLAGYVVTMSSDNYLKRLKKLYNVVTTPQLMILVIMLPILLVIQNIFFSHLIPKNARQ